MLLALFLAIGERYRPGSFLERSDFVGRFLFVDLAGFMAGRWSSSLSLLLLLLLLQDRIDDALVMIVMF